MDESARREDGDVTVKLLAAGIAALIAVGEASTAAGSVQIQPAVFEEPSPGSSTPNPSPPAELPTAGQLTAILTTLTDPGTPDRAKNGLVQGGIVGSTAGERRAFNNARLKKAAAHGELPLSFTVGNIWPVGPNTAAAEVVIAGPKLTAPVIKVLTFLNEGGWMLSSDSAAALIQTVTKD